MYSLNQLCASLLLVIIILEVIYHSFYCFYKSPSRKEDR